MRQFLLFLKPLCQKVLILVFTVIQVSVLFAAIAQPSIAADNSASERLTTEERLDRAFDEYGTTTGIQEEIYQKRLSEGQDPEKMPKPYKRIVGTNNKEVPETSALETSISKVRELVDKVKPN